MTQELDNKQKKEWAKLLFLTTDLTQAEIAVKIEDYYRTMGQRVGGSQVEFPPNPWGTDQIDTHAT